MNRTPAPSSALAPVLEFLQRHAPFDRMEPADREDLARHLKLGFYAQGEIVAAPSHGIARRYYIIKQGRVRGESTEPGVAAEEGAWELVTGESFPIGALLGRRPVHTVHRAVEDTFCLELEGEHFDRLRAQSAVFRDFCARRLANLLDQARQDLQTTLAGEAAQGVSLSTPLARLIARAPVSCRGHTPLRQALQIMHDERVGSVVITDEAQRPQGVFTLHDLLSRVALPQTALDSPIAAVMTPHPVSLPPLALAYDAALVMARQGISHVCVVESGRLAGVVSEGDLFALQQVGLVNLSRAIASAPSLAALAQASGDMQRLIDRMLVQGASVAQLNQIITLLNDQIGRRVIALCAAQAAPTTAFTWLAFGSEGRQEQTLKTDQDNGILFMSAPGQSPETQRAQLLPFARRVNDALATVGYPLCPGGIMAGNPECCLSLPEWRARFDAWIARGEPADLLNASIFFDFRVLHGDEAPAQALGEAVREQAAATPRFLRQMAENALNNQPPLGLLRDFVVESGGARPRTLDLKLRGATPFVDGARLLALAHGLIETNTLARLRALAQRGVVPAEEAAAWSDAYAYVQLLRMREHQRQARAGEPLDNHIDPDALNELDRRILKEAFRQARKLQARISLDYQL